jgi:2-keto-4-pentenoate hydratase/2-oxohepta-3-ene-1,7-dioic acid hydratase in catechol pathway
MKIARFTHDGRTRLGVVDGDEMIDVGSVDPGIPTDVGMLLEIDAMDRLRRNVDQAPRLSLSEVHLEAPIIRPPEFLAVGLNYADHVSEGGREIPKAPVVFNKQATCITGPYDPIHIPAAAPSMVDYEGELGVVIGTRCKNVTPDKAHEVVAGYLVVDDVSVRDWQRATPTMTMGKSWDTHGPIGPWLVTADEIPDPHDLRVQTWVDGDLRQDARTSMLIHDIWSLIAHLSTAFTLLPGTIIATGTPAGVGIWMDPPGTLRAGQTVRIEVEKVGIIENPVIDEPA